MITWPHGEKPMGDVDHSLHHPPDSVSQGRLTCGLSGVWRALLPIALFCPSACSNILGIDPPQALPSGGSAGATAAGQSSSDAGSENGGAISNGGMAGDAGTAGAPGDAGTGGDAGTAGGAGTGGNISNAGSAGKPTVAGEGDPVIDAPKAATLCPGASVDVNFAVTGGQPPYDWSLLPATSGFAVSVGGANRERANVTGIATQAGLTGLKVQVTDALQHTTNVPFPVSVSSPPVIQNLVVPSVCPNELYALDLKAVGGDASSYQWSTNLSTTTGLTIRGQRLQGKLSSTTVGPTTLHFNVSVQDSGSCASAPVTLDLSVESPGASACFAVSVDGLATNLPPPPLCLGGDYNQRLIVTRGQAPYQWSANALPRGLSFDPSTQALSGTFTSDAPSPLPPEPLSIQVKDGTGRTIETNVLLQARDKCWFAYVGKVAGVSRLHLFDALLGNEKIFPGGSGDSVQDFKFSPDGRYLAYRLANGTGPARLSIVKLATWQERLLTFTGVQHYQWSPNSGILAVAYSFGSSRVLGGVDVANALPASGASGTSIEFPVLIRLETSVDSEPVWFGSNADQLAFLTTVQNFRFLNSATFSAQGNGAEQFTLPNLRTDSFPQATELKGTPQGVFAIPESFSIEYYLNDGSDDPAYHDDVLVAPSGNYVARAQDGALALFRPTDDSEETPRAQKDGCDTILAWASGKERIACAHQTANAGSELSFFDVTTNATTDTDSLTALPTLPLQVPSQRRRLFAPSGKTFAFSTDTSLTVIQQTNTGPATVVFQTVGSSGFAEFSFSPDEARVLQHQGNRISFFDLLGGSRTDVTISDGLSQSVQCVEDSRDTAVGWCGVERPGSAMTWSPDSRLAAFQQADGTLQIYEFTSRAHTALNQCQSDCTAPLQFTFQP